MQQFLVFIAIYVGTLAAMFVMFGIISTWIKERSLRPLKDPRKFGTFGRRAPEPVNSPPL